jgi:hypothetical protein
MVHHATGMAHSAGVTALQPPSTCQCNLEPPRDSAISHVRLAQHRHTVIMFEEISVEIR